MSESDGNQFSSARSWPEHHGSAALEALVELVMLWSSDAFQRPVFHQAAGASEPLPMNLLYRLAVRGPMKPSQLADELVTGRSNISKVTARLEQTGLIERAPDPADGRGVVVALTPQGHLVARRLFDIGDQMMLELTGDWAPNRLEEFTRMLDDFLTRAHAYAARVARTEPAE